MYALLVETTKSQMLKELLVSTDHSSTAVASQEEIKLDINVFHAQ
jgi:hypothetical protein